MNLPPQIPLRAAAARANQASRVLWPVRRPAGHLAAPKLAGPTAFLAMSRRSSLRRLTRRDGPRPFPPRRGVPDKAFPEDQISAIRPAIRSTHQLDNVRSETKRRRQPIPVRRRRLLPVRQASSSGRSVQCRTTPPALFRDERAPISRTPLPLEKSPDVVSGR